MGVKRIKAPADASYYVIATGYTADDLVAMGPVTADGRVPLPAEYAETTITYWQSRQQAERGHPAARTAIARQSKEAALVETDAGAGVAIEKSHATKAIEAVRVLRDGETDLAWLPFLAAELAERPGLTLTDLAQEVWGKHQADAPAEAARTAKKRAIRGD